MSQVPTPLFEYTDYSISIPVVGTMYSLQGKLCIPHKKDSPNSTKDLDLTVILHGFLGHKDYCYQKQLAYDIPKYLGQATIRFDFMGCGDSFPPYFLNRDIQNDIRDLDSMLEWIRAYNNRVDQPSASTETVFDFQPPTKQKLILRGGVAHSRGSHALLAWGMVHALASPEYANAVSQIPDAVKLNQYYLTPGVRPMGGHIKADGTLAPPLEFLATCSGRYRTSYLIESYENRIGDFKERTGEKLKLRRPTTKRIEDSWVPYDEIVSLSDIPIGKILDVLLATWASVPPEIVPDFKQRKFITSKFLTLYGDSDHIVPVLDGYMYTSHFKRARLVSHGKLEQGIKQTWHHFGTLINNPLNPLTRFGTPKMTDWEYYWDHSSSESSPASSFGENGAFVVNGRNYTPITKIYQAPLRPSVDRFVLVPNADHNFYGKPRAHIVPAEKKANYNPQVVNAVINWYKDSEIYNETEKDLAWTPSAYTRRETGKSML